LGFRIIRKPADKTHQYGHGKVETLATVIIGVALFLVGLKIFWGGTVTIFKTLRGNSLYPPAWIAFYAAIISIISKEWLYRYTAKVGKEINSQAVIANAWHHRSDAFSSVGTMLGIGGAIILGNKWSILDPLAAIIVSFFIVQVAVFISKTGFNELLEASLSEKTENEIMQVVKSIPGIIDAHGMKSRKIGSTIAIDIHAEVDKSLSVTHAHDIATAVENSIMDAFGEDTIINVHIEPSSRTIDTQS
jgi:cation diffusion facilitator family transporter